MPILEDNDADPVRQTEAFRQTSSCQCVWLLEKPESLPIGAKRCVSLSIPDATLMQKLILTNYLTPSAQQPRLWRPQQVYVGKVDAARK